MSAISSPHRHAFPRHQRQARNIPAIAYPKTILLVLPLLFKALQNLSNPSRPLPSPCSPNPSAPLTACAPFDRHRNLAQSLRRDPTTPPLPNNKKTRNPTSWTRTASTPTRTNTANPPATTRAQRRKTRRLAQTRRGRMSSMMRRTRKRSSKA